MVQHLRDTHSPAFVERALRFLSIRLRARPASAPLAAEVDAWRVRITERTEALAVAAEERVACTAEIRWLDAERNGAMAQLARDVNALVRGRFDDPRYRRLFPAVPSAQMRPVAGAAKDRFVAHVLEALANDPPLASLRAHHAPLADWPRQVGEAVARRESLRRDELRAREALVLAANEARRGYNLLPPRLALMFPEQRALVASYFRDGRAVATRAAAPAADNGAVTEGIAPANENAAHDGAATHPRSTRRRRVA